MSIGYKPNGSIDHDHLCRCPGCDYDGPEPTDEQVAAMELEQAWYELQNVRSYVEVQAAVFASEK